MKLRNLEDSVQQRSRYLVAARRERGAVLLLATVIVIVLLIGGLAVVAVTSSELAGTAGYRSQHVWDACAEAGVENIRAKIASLDEARAVSGTLHLNGGAGGSELTYRAGHYDDTAETVTELDPASFDVSSLYAGENITNSLGASPGSGQRVFSAVAVCSGSGSAKQEVQMIFRYGTPTH